MKNQTLPYDLYRNDSLYGTIVSTNGSGIRILLEMDDESITEAVYAFASSGGKIGQKVLVSIQWFNTTHNNFRVTVDSYITEAPQSTTVNNDTYYTAKIAA